MKIYTKTGDGGQTSLANNQRVSKDDPRLETYGTADELNAWVGMLRAHLSTITNCQHTDQQLLRIQNQLFNIGASLSLAPGEWINEQDVSALEQAIDQMQEQLPPIHAFILPAGSEIIARCHVCRTITRRLERQMIAIQYANTVYARYVNRLSDYFFVLARWIGEQTHTTPVIWQK